MGKILTAVQGKKAKGATSHVRSLYCVALVINTMLLILLPTGSLFGVNFKILTFLAMLPLAAYLTEQISSSRITNWVLFFVVPAGIFVWVLIADLYGSSLGLAVLQAKDLLATIAGAWFISVYCKLLPENSVRFIRLVLLGISTTALLKCLVFVYCSLKGINVSVFILAISQIFHINLMTVDFDNSNLGRFQLFSDQLLPLAIFSLFCLRKRSISLHRLHPYAFCY